MDIEITEHYENGRCVRRTVNGIEVEPDEHPTVIQFARNVTTKTYLTHEEYAEYQRKRGLLA